MRRFALTGFLLLATVASAEVTWDRLSDAGIREALTDATLVYGNTATQRFYVSGRTLYTTGQDSWGYWEARDGRYCSQWPPADGWACYDVDMQGDQIRFTGDNGDVTEGIRK